jgi:hypothetical protein
MDHHARTSLGPRRVTEGEAAAADGRHRRPSSRSRRQQGLANEPRQRHHEVEAIVAFTCLMAARTWSWIVPMLLARRLMISSSLGGGGVVDDTAARTAAISRSGLAPSPGVGTLSSSALADLTSIAPPTLDHSLTTRPWRTNTSSFARGPADTRRTPGAVAVEECRAHLRACPSEPLRDAEDPLRRMAA